MIDYRNIYRINWWATLKICFMKFPLKDAVKLPVLVFGQLMITDLSGSIKFNCPVRRGMLRIGFNMEMEKTTTRSAQFGLGGTIIVNGLTVIGSDVCCIISKGASLTVGYQSYIGLHCKLIVTQDVILGKYVRMGYDSQLITTNFHYMMDVKTGIVRRHSRKKIVIGDYCWIGNHSTIMLGTIIPPHTIVASHSLVNKDMSYLEKHSMVGGIPAKFIKLGVSRIFNPDAERVIQKYFDAHPDEDEYDASGLEIY